MKYHHFHHFRTNYSMNNLKIESSSLKPSQEKKDRVFKFEA
uniref:Uncharacterized protein n=1 Tax=Lepeophtheirus salmonis TaxID=72036 RepID=A0A0K2TSM2_LEPSM